MASDDWTMKRITAAKPLFRTYWEKVFELCYYYSKDYNTSKDLTQNIFLDLWEREVAFPDKASLEKYLTRCAKYQVLNYFRYSNQTERRPLEQMPEPVSNQYNPEVQLQYKQLSVQLEGLIHTLREPCRSIFCMSRKEFLSHREIAGRMGITVSTVEYHIGNALKSLRQRLRAPL